MKSHIFTNEGFKGPKEQLKEGFAVGAPKFWANLSSSTELCSQTPLQKWNLDAFYSPEASSNGPINARFGCYLTDAHTFDNNFFRLPKPEALLLDPHARMLLETTQVPRPQHLQASSFIKTAQHGHERQFKILTDTRQAVFLTYIRQTQKALLIPKKSWLVFGLQLMACEARSWPLQEVLSETRLLDGGSSQIGAYVGCMWAGEYVGMLPQLGLQVRMVLLIHVPGKAQQ